MRWLFNYWGLLLLISTIVFFSIINTRGQSVKIETVQEKGNTVKINPQKLLREYQKLEQQISKRFARQKIPLLELSKKFLTSCDNLLPACKKTKVVKIKTKTAQKLKVFFFSAISKKQLKKALSLPADVYLVAVEYKKLPISNKRKIGIMKKEALSKLKINCLPAFLELKGKDMIIKMQKP
jgi:hypothetical protein